MSSVSLTSLLSTLRNRTDKAATNRWSDALLTGFINDGVKELWDLLITVDPDPITTSSSQTTTSGTSTYARPSDAYVIRGVDLVHSSTDVSTLFPISFSLRNRYKNCLGRSYCTPRYFDGRGDNLVIIPTPSVSNETLTVWYISYPTTLSSGSDTIDFQNGWEDYVLNYAAEQLAARDEDENIQYFMMRKQEVRNRIITAARHKGTSPFTAANLKYICRGR